MASDGPSARLSSCDHAGPAGKHWRRTGSVPITCSDMGVKIKANDDRILAIATAVLLLSRDDLSQRGATPGLITRALAVYRTDYAGYKALHPKRDRAAVSDLSSLPQQGRREVYEKLLAAVDVILARIERNSTQFSSLLELDNFFAFNLKQFD